MLVIAVDETTLNHQEMKLALNTEYGIADALIAAWGRKDLIGKCLCDLIDEDSYYKCIVIAKILDEATPVLEAKFASEKH